ncbi:MAG: ABC transporter permease subunit [Acidimicrobiia bacterium]|nr:amino acid ABC transporter permease [Acidimicrobiia bacterium]MDQ3501138.1 amino acid ABC transporter permease [Actinomycetota bacterium]
MTIAAPRRRWVKKNLFGGVWSSLVTIGLGLAIGYVAFVLIRFLATADFTILRRNLALFMVGSFPRPELWRVAVAVLILAVAAGVAGGLINASARLRAHQAGLPVPAPPGPRSLVNGFRRYWPLALLIAVCLLLTETVTPTILVLGAIGILVASSWALARLPYSRWSWSLVVALPFVAYLVLSSSGLGWDKWGGFMLNIFLTVAGILFAFPIGLSLALGRRSSLPIVRTFSVAYIELFRGVPLITLLLLGVFALRLFLPSQLNPSSVTRILVAITIFEAAYIAEVIRGGLQSLPTGQVEAASSLGLSTWKTTRLIVLPQALRATIPAMVGQFISLFKDTTLVAAVGLSDMLNTSSIATSQPEFNARGLARITLPFVALAFWAGSYTMSREARRLERRLGIGER